MTEGIPFQGDAFEILSRPFRVVGVYKLEQRPFPEREGALWAAARHFAHLSQRPESDGGVMMFSRPDAEFVLSMVAVLHAHVEPK